MEKFERVLRSRKFWALLASLVAIAAGYATGQVDVWQSVQAAVASFGFYAVGTGLDNGPAPLPEVKPEVE